MERDRSRGKTQQRQPERPRDFARTAPTSHTFWFSDFQRFFLRATIVPSIAGWTGGDGRGVPLCLSFFSSGFGVGGLGVDGGGAGGWIGRRVSFGRWSGLERRWARWRLRCRDAFRVQGEPGPVVQDALRVQDAPEPVECRTSFGCRAMPEHWGAGRASGAGRAGALGCRTSFRNWSAFRYAGRCVRGMLLGYGPRRGERGVSFGLDELAARPAACLISGPAGRAGWAARLKPGVGRSPTGLFSTAAGGSLGLICTGGCAAAGRAATRIASAGGFAAGAL